MPLAAALTGSVPAPILALARRILARQSTVPESPGYLDEKGGPLLCTAAAIAAAGVELAGDAEARRGFEQSLLRSGDKRLVADAFRARAWPVALCDLAMTTNDRLDPLERQAAVLTMLAAAEAAHI
jgi:hypothetical protein